MAEIEHNDTPEEEDAKWIWGLFYYNPADKRIFPPKRVRWLGWTVNFANPYSILAMVAVIAVAIYIGDDFL